MTSVVRILQPSGILDGNSANDLGEEAIRYAQEGAKIVLLDFSEVKFINSSGIGTLVFSLKSTRKLGAELCICSLSFQVRDIFRITKMDKLFKVFSSRQEFEESADVGAFV